MLLFGIDGFGVACLFRDGLTVLLVLCCCLVIGGGWVLGGR